MRVFSTYRLLCLLVFALVLPLALSLLRPLRVDAIAGILKQINFQGKVVTKTTGTNIANGDYSFTFQIYNVATGGTQIWTETKTITVTNGIFQTLLGSSTALPGSLDFNTQELYLGINFNSDGEMLPRVRFAAVPYAFNALKVAGLTVTDTTGTLTIPNATTIAFSGANNVTFTSTSTTTLNLPTTGTLATLAGTEEFTNKTIGSTGLVFSGATNDITTVTNQHLAIMPNGNGNVGIGTTTPTEKLGIAGNATISGTIALGPIAPAAAGTCDASAKGKQYFDGTTNKMYYCNGSGWTDMTGGAGGSSNWKLNLGTLSSGNDTMDLLIGSNATASAKFAFMNVNSGAPTASISGNLSIASPTGANPATLYNILNGGSFNLQSSVGGDAGLASRLFINNGGNVGIGTTTPTSFMLELAGSIGPSANITYNLGSDTRRWASVYTNQLCLTGDCKTAWPTGTGSSLWQETLGAVSPYSNSLDLLLGGTSTASSKFAFMNVNSGTPTASVSAGVAGGTFLTATGYLSTTARQDLTLGNSATFNTTGNILLNPNGTGNVGIGTTAPGGKLDVQSTQTSGTISLIGAPSAVTLAGALTGQSIDVQTNYTAGSNARTGLSIGAITPTAGTETAITIGSGWDTSIAFNTVGTNTISIANTGNLTFYDSAANGLFQISDNGTASIVSVLGTGSYFQAGNITYSGTGLGSWSNTNINVTPNGTGDFIVNTDDLYVDTSSGFVGIGTTNPGAVLGVNNTTGISAPITGLSIILSGAGAFDQTGLSFALSNASGTNLNDILGSGSTWKVSTTGGATYNATSLIGTVANGLTFNPASGPSYSGTARPYKSIVLSPEFAGAAMTAFYGAGTETSITGSMTSDASSSAGLRTYYNWTSTAGTLQSYVVAVRIRLPLDFSQWCTTALCANTNALQVDYLTLNATSTNNALDMHIYNSSNTATAVVSSTSNATAANTWTTLSIQKASLEGAQTWNTAGDVAIVYLRMRALGNNFVLVGDIKLNYLASY